MTNREILELRWKIEKDPILTDEEIDFISEAMDKQAKMTPMSNQGEYTCPMCELTIVDGDEYCWHCGQKLDWEDYDGY